MNIRKDILDTRKGQLPAGFIRIRHQIYNSPRDEWQTDLSFVMKSEEQAIARSLITMTPITGMIPANHTLDTDTTGTTLPPPEPIPTPQQQRIAVSHLNKRH